jgi:hypothetical protein
MSLLNKKSATTTGKAKAVPQKNAPIAVKKMPVKKNLPGQSGKRGG